jgi:hypothetical protein
MPIPTRRRPPPRLRLPRSSAERRRRSTLIAGAAAYAAAELAAGLLIGRLFEWGRAEALLFFAFRPWLLVVAAWLVSRFDLRRRILFYLLALGIAGLAESLLLIALGGNPWLEMLRGWAAGAIAAAVADGLVQLGGRFVGRIGRVAGAALGFTLLLVPHAQAPYETIALGATGPRSAPQKPALLLMTALPLVWGETGPFDPDSRPAEAYLALKDEFEVRPLDFVDAAGLRRARLMLIAQPRALAPDELVALDAWVRGGGRVLILVDPDLAWPSGLPLGDPRRPPPVSLLAPLLDHWGLALEPAASGPVLDGLDDGGMLRRLALDGPARFRIARGGCRSFGRPYLVFCNVGAGKVLLVADADLLRDDLWASPGRRGSERHRRLADNPLVVAGWLDRLGGLDRERVARPVRWQRPGANRGLALALGSLPILAVFVAAFLLRRRPA